MKRGSRRRKISATVSEEAVGILSAIARRSSLSASRVIDALILAAEGVKVSVQLEVGVVVKKRRKGA